jgi:polyisoprenoid-binding protein YceI
MTKVATLCLAVFCCSLNVQAQVFMTESGYVEFTSSVPLHSFQGTSNQLVGKINLNDSTVDFYVDLNTIKTGIGKRDKDMRETLNTEKYPFAEFFGKLNTPFDPTKSGKQPATVEGEFSIHGVSRQVSIDGTLERTDDGLLVEASWTINLKDYDIEPPGILFYRVDENQKLQIKALLGPDIE